LLHIRQTFALVLAMVPVLASCGGALVDDAFEAPAATAAPEQPAAPPMPTTLAFVSGPDWLSFAGNLDGAQGSSLGPATPVCVTSDVPPNCPPGAVVYKTSGSGWAASYPGALWIWSTGVTPNAPSDMQFAVFEKTFILGASPRGLIQFAADDLAEVLVNGARVGSTGSVANVHIAWSSQNRLATLDLSPYLVEGRNTLTVVGQNGPASFTGGACSPCTYTTNTAGVVFGGSLTYGP
jgi:hypothetical protein